MKLTVTETISRSAADTARLVGEFTRLAEWHPAYGDCTVEGNGRGAVRTVRMGNELFSDQLESQADDASEHIYHQLRGPLPIAALRAIVRVRPTAEAECTVECTFEVDPGDVPEAAVAGALRGICRAGLLNAKLMLEGQLPTAARAPSEDAADAG